MNNLEKINILNEKIVILSNIIDNLQYGIENLPWDESKGTDSRQDNIIQYTLKKNAILKELQGIQDSDIIY